MAKRIKEDKVAAFMVGKTVANVVLFSDEMLVVFEDGSNITIGADFDHNRQTSSLGFGILSVDELNDWLA